jgi:hypothetical protein
MRPVRINGVIVSNPEKGSFYLLRRSPVRGDDSYILSRTPGRTNKSHEEMHSGWLGTTNDVAFYAEEAIEMDCDISETQWSYRRFPASELAEKEEASEMKEPVEDAHPL